MADQLTDTELCERAWEALKDRLGITQAMRFMSMVRNPRRDYISWRQAHFKDLDASSLLAKLRAASDDR